MTKKHKGRKPTEADWVALRMLYLVLCGDSSSAVLRDVQKTVRYFDNKLGANFYPSMALIVAENGKLGTLDNPESALSRRLDKSIVYQDEINWPAAEDLNAHIKPSWGPLPKKSEGG